MRRQRPVGEAAAPYLRFVLGLGEYPEGIRLRGWVAAEVDGVLRDRQLPETIGRYGPGIEAACRAAGFEPAFLTAIEDQLSAAQAAAARWRQALIAAARY